MASRPTPTAVQHPHDQPWCEWCVKTSPHRPPSRGTKTHCKPQRTRRQPVLPAPLQVDCQQRPTSCTYIHTHTRSLQATAKPGTPSVVPQAFAGDSLLQELCGDALLAAVPGVGAGRLIQAVLRLPAVPVAPKRLPADQKLVLAGLGVNLQCRGWGFRQTSTDTAAAGKAAQLSSHHTPPDGSRLHPS